MPYRFGHSRDVRAAPMRFESAASVNDVSSPQSATTMHNRALRPTRVLVLIGLVVSLGACKDIVYRDRPLFDEPLASAGGFLGYLDESQKQTVCGQCHVSRQNRWQETKHSDAWATLTPAQQALELCQSCHTTSSRGNVVEGDAGGYLGHSDARYHDVQCESCHGPGLQHVRSPQRNNWPLAPLAAGVELEVGCGECHSGAHQPFVEQWASSGHARVVASRATNPSCSSCHRAQDILKQWGVQSQYLEKDSTAQLLPVTCGVCHDPHDATNPAQLRLPVDVASEEENLCMQCHHKRGTPDPTTFRGPHSPEGPLLLGFAGWWPPNMTIRPGGLVATHGSERNPRLCAGCHVNSWEKTDELTGEFVFRSTGHTFEAIPCVDAGGIPTGLRDCTIEERSFRACVDCHGEESIARNLMVFVRDERLAPLIAGLEAMEADVPATEYDDDDTRYTTAEGARFNRELAQFPGSEIHNPWLIEALLRGSIRQMETDYGITPPPGLNLSPELDIVR